MATPKQQSGITEATVKKMVVKESKSIKEMLNKYFVDDVPGDFSLVPTSQKLAYIQRTPEKFIKKRLVGQTNIPYVDHFFAEKCLNFAFGFNWSYSVTKENFYEYNEKFFDKKDKKTKERPVIEAEVMMEFVAEYDGKEIKRTIASGHKYYSNPATTRMDAIKSAISKGITTFARQFGVGADIKDSEAKAYREVEDTVIDIEEEKDDLDGFSIPKNDEKPQEEGNSEKGEEDTICQLCNRKPCECRGQKPEEKPKNDPGPTEVVNAEVGVIPKKTEEKDGVTEIQDAELVEVSVPENSVPKLTEEECKEKVEEIEEDRESSEKEALLEMFGEEVTGILEEIAKILDPSKTTFELIPEFERLSKKYINRNVFTDDPIPTAQIRFILTMVKKQTTTTEDIAKKAKEEKPATVEEFKEIFGIQDEPVEEKPKQQSLKDVFSGKKSEESPSGPEKVDWKGRMENLFERLKVGDEDKKTILSTNVGKVDSTTLTEAEAEKIVGILEKVRMSNMRRAFKASARKQFGDDDESYRKFVLELSGNRADTSMNLTESELLAGLDSMKTS